MTFSFIIIAYLPFAVFSGARVYALCRTWLPVISALVTLLSLAPVCMNWVDWALFEKPTSIQFLYLESIFSLPRKMIPCKC
ncbi:hypothetical protein C8Q80DRAFT_655137 [Daedaleopsis nitida]|nr:hypothetical protein C8Q80DRAFT_655137 [Daedaleopsis nitida]